MISRRRVLLGAAAAACAPAFAHSEPAVTAADPVDEAGFVDIGGISQWVAIQGAKASNPAVLFLHGGPANAQSPFLRTFLPWEDDFTVINWDQRGSGKTYGRNGPSTPGMDTPAAALECLMNDAIEVAIYASRRLSKRKLILVGHSWGAMLALHVVKRRPDLFHAFCGTGFPVSWKDSLTDAEAWARAQASAAGDETTLKALDAAAQLPLDDFHRLQASGKYRMTSDDMAYLKMQDAFFRIY